jgi:hypothetical protein
MSMMVKIRLADVPDFAWKEYHEDQVRVYSKLTEFAFEALKMPLIQEWLESFAEKLDIQNVEVRLNRMPHHEAKVLPVECRGREVFKPIGTFGRSSKKHAFIEIYPLPLFIDKTSKPYIRPSLRGEILEALRTIIHEMLHQAGIWDEGEAKRLTEIHYSQFRQTNKTKFDQTIKPLLRKWRREIAKLGL